MENFPKPMQRLIRELSRLPSIGEKSATRLAYFLVHNEKSLAITLAEAMKHASETVRLCERCFYFAEDSLCTICKNVGREPSLLCVVEKPMDLMAIERVGEYRGSYHVLHGLWAPLRGQGPESMKLGELCARLDEKVIKEVILATSATVEGDATALYVARIVEDKGIKATRLAQGMQKGAELEYADEVTLSRAFSGRSVMNG